MSRKTIAAQTGVAFELKKGESLKVIDPQGQQVADLFCFDAHGRTDALSSGRSIDYNDTIYFSEGHKLYSNAGEVLMTIVKDTCGRHDFLVTPCSQQMFTMVSGSDECHPSCQENLAKNLERFDIRPWQITTTFNIFMNVPADSKGRIQVLPPVSKAGDYIIFEAQRDLIVGLTACSDEATNNGVCKPIEFEILPASN